MRSLVLALALAALLAPAAPASIPQSEPFEKKLADAVKEVLETDAKIQKADDVEQPNTVKDVDNQLLKKAPEDIPVKVVVEDIQPALEVSEDKKDDEKNEVIYNEVDLKHPGEPQRQEHETQNPEHHEDQDSALTALKQMIADSQVVFNNGFKDVSEHIAEWLRDNKPEISIKDSIDNLQEQFMENIDKLNSTIQSYWNQGVDAEKQEDIKKVQSGLKVLEEKFESGVQNLNNGVRTLAVLKTGRDDATTAKPFGSPFPEFVTTFWQTVTSQFSNVTSQFQNMIGQNNATQTPPGAQSDDPSGTTVKPGVWQSVTSQLQGLFQNKPGQQGAQNDEQPSQSGPFAQVIQNVPLLQNFVNFIQPKPQSAEPSKPVEPAKPSEGSNVVPAESQASSDPVQPTDQQQKKPDEQAQPAQPQRPIQQIIQKNPIVQSITGAVQKIQHSITNPEKPREDAVEKEAAEKGGFFPYYGHGHHGHRPSDGDNNDSGVGLEKSVPVETEKSASVEVPGAVEAEKKTPVEAEKNAPVEAIKSAPIEAQSAPVEVDISPVQAVKSVVVEAEKSAIAEPVKSAPVEAQSTPVEAEKPAPASVSQEVVKQD